MIEIKPFFHQDTATFSYVAYDKNSSDAVIFDPVLDYNQLNSSISAASLAEILAFISQNNLTPRLVIDTHSHADHFSGAYPLKNILQIKSAIGIGFLEIKNYFAKFYDMNDEIKKLNSPYDILVKDQQILQAGSFSIKAITVPGHTASCTAYLINDAIFCGDALLMPELGCGRCDFPGGSAENLYNSITKNIFSLPDSTRIFVGHDYPPDGQAPQCETSVAQSKQKNIMLNSQTSKEEFIKKRTDKDKTLSSPRLLLAAMQMNILGGQVLNYLKFPLTIEEIS